MLIAHILLGLTLSLPPSTHAMNLKEALTQAEQNSPRIAMAKSRQSEAEWRRTEAFSTFLPSLTAGANYLGDYKYAYTDINFGGNPVSVPQILPTTTYTLTAQYTLFEGFGGMQRWRSARHLGSAAEQALDWTRFEVEHTVELQFYRAVAARTLKEVAEQNLKTLEDHMKEAGMLRKAGVSTHYDLLRVDVQVSEAQSELLNAEDNIQLELGRLAEILGRTDVARLEGTLPTLDPKLIAGASLQQISSRPDLIAANESDEGAKLKESAARSHWSPRLAAFWNYQSYNNLNDQYNDWQSFRDAYTVGLNLQWNLFDGFAATARAHEATEQRYQAEKATQIKVLKAKQDFDMWKRKFLYYCAVFKSRQGEVAKAKEAARLAKEGRRVGARTNSDMLDAETDLYRAQAGSVAAQLGAVEALINLELTTGQRFFQPMQE